MGFLRPASYVENMAVWIFLELFLVCLFVPPLPPAPKSYSYGFGSAGKEKFQIPPDAELQYEVKLKSFEKVGMRDEVPKRVGGGRRSASTA